MDTLETVKTNAKLNSKLWNKILIAEIQKERMLSRNILNAYKSANEIFAKSIYTNTSKISYDLTNGRKHQDYN